MTENDEKLNKVSKMNERLKFIAGVIPFLQTIFEIATFSIVLTLVVQQIRINQYQAKAQERSEQAALVRQKMLDNQERMIQSDLDVLKKLNQILLSEAKMETTHLILQKEMDSIRIIILKLKK